MFIPIFLLSFANDFFGTGLLLSIYDVVFLISIPVVAYLATYFSGKKLILWGLALYPLIGLFYFLGGVWGALAFVILARAINGVTYSLDRIGKMTYIRQHAVHWLSGHAFKFLVDCRRVHGCLSFKICYVAVSLSAYHSHDAYSDTFHREALKGATAAENASRWLSWLADGIPQLPLIIPVYVEMG